MQALRGLLYSEMILVTNIYYLDFLVLENHPTICLEYCCKDIKVQSNAYIYIVNQIKSFILAC